MNRCNKPVNKCLIGMCILNVIVNTLFDNENIIAIGNTSILQNVRKNFSDKNIKKFVEYSKFNQH